MTIIARTEVYLIEAKRVGTIDTAVDEYSELFIAEA